MPKRKHLLDTIRGITLLSMILYHGMWDLRYFVGFSMPWYEGIGAFIWQQSICCTFIFLSGFCIIFSQKLFKRGLIVFGAGLLVTVVTMLFVPGDRVVMGVLTLLGSGMLLMVPIRKLFARFPVSSLAGLLVSLFLFLGTRGVNEGYLGAYGVVLTRLPQALYANLFTTYLGFPMTGFYSTDYFSLFPWFFLMLAGFFAGKLCEEKGVLSHPVFDLRIPVLSFMGRHSLFIYLIHQPILYVIPMIIAWIIILVG